MAEIESSGGRRSRQPWWLAAEAALVALLLFCPLAIASVHLGSMIAASGIALVALGLVAWASLKSGEPFHVPWPVPAFAVVVAFIGLQLVPLPPALISLLAPRTHEVFEFVLGPLGSYPAWRPLSLDPQATARELGKAVGYLAAFLAAVQVARSRRARSRLLNALGVAGLAVAVIGFGHALWGATELFGVFRYSFARPPFLTTFGNPNHLASFLGLAGTALLARALSERDRKIATLWGLAYLAVGVGVLLSLSRGGIVAFAAGQLMLGIAAHLVRRREREGSAVHAGSLGVAGAVLGVLAVSAYLAWEALSSELATTDSFDEIGQSKVGLWPSFLPMLKAHWLVGVGRGAFEPVYQAFQEPSLRASLTHPENLLFQWSLELGAPLALLLTTACVYALVQAMRRNLGDLERLACAVGVGMVALHELVDFGLELGGLAMPTMVAFGLAMARREAELRVKRRAAVAVVPVLAGVAVVAFVLGRSSARDDGAALIARTTNLPAVAIEGAALPLIERHPADYLPHVVVAEAWAQAQPPRYDKVVAWANRAMFLHPGQAPGHRLAARALRSVGRHDQARLEYRLAFTLGDRGALAEGARAYDVPSSLRALVPDDERGQVALVDELLRHKRIDLADQVASAALSDLEGRAGDKGAHSGLELLKRLARIAALRKDPDALEALGRRMEALAPTDAVGMRTRADSLVLRGDLPAAIAALQAGAKRHPTDLESALKAAELHLRARDTRGCREALARMPAQADLAVRTRVLTLEARAAEMDGQGAKAVGLMRMAVTLRPKDGPLRLQYALMLERLGRFDLATREATTLLEESKALAAPASALRQRLEAKRKELEANGRWQLLMGNGKGP